MRLPLAGLLVAFAAAPFGGEARADPYRWCANYIGDSGRNCYFLTLEQCRAAAAGNGNICTPNAFYTGERPERRSKRWRG